MRSRRHLLADSAQLVQQLRALPRVLPNQDVKYYKIDIKEFFMNGEHHDIARAAISLLPRDMRGSVELMILFLLREQFVAAPHHFVRFTEGREFQRLFRVSRGSGMGLPMSRELSDANFLVEAEDSYCLRSGICHEHGVFYYGRYADDILVIFVDTVCETRMRFLQGFKRHSRSYPLKVESVSSDEVQMLDMLISLGPDGKFVTKPFVKPTSQRNFLSDRSYHHPNIHMCWPIGYLSRLRRISTHESDARRAQLQFLSELLAQCPSHVARFAMQSSIFNPRASAKADFGRCSWLVLPYTRYWLSAGIGGFLREQAANGSKLMPNLNVRLCWRNCAPDWYVRLRKKAMA